MSKLYKFARLIAKYSVAYEVITSGKGGYVNGKYQKGEEVVKKEKGAIVPFSDKKIYQSGGSITRKERQLIRSEPICDFENVTIRYKGNVYKVEENTDYGDYSDAYSYVLRWVSTFG